MIDADFDHFAAVVGGFAELKGRVLSADAVRLYWAAMRDRWELDDFKAAAEQLLRTCTFMPTPKDFEDLRKAGRMTAAEAWVLALRSAPSVVSCGHVTDLGTSGNALVDVAARAVGGYGKLYLAERDELPFLERRFCEHYETLEDAEDTREAVPQLSAPNLRASLIGPSSERPGQALPLRLTGPAFAPSTVAARPAPTAIDPPRDLRADVCKLAAAGFDAEGIALALRPRGISLDQIRECLQERLSA